ARSSSGNPFHSVTQLLMDNLITNRYKGTTRLRGSGINRPGSLIDAAVGELCLAVLTGTCPDFVTTAVGTKFLLGWEGGE
ncbi:hypothetical protein Tco_1485793, partial [Tanacetum coccineum]